MSNEHPQRYPSSRVTREMPMRTAARDCFPFLRQAKMKLILSVGRGSRGGRKRAQGTFCSVFNPSCLLESPGQLPAILKPG